MSYRPGRLGAPPAVPTTLVGQIIQGFTSSPQGQAIIGDVSQVLAPATAQIGQQGVTYWLAQHRDTLLLAGGGVVLLAVLLARR